MARDSRARRRRRRERRQDAPAEANGGPPAAEAEDPLDAPVEETGDAELDALIAKLADTDLHVELTAEAMADVQVVKPILERIVASQEGELQLTGEQLIELVRQAKAAGVRIPEAEEQPEEAEAIAPEDAVEIGEEEELPEAEDEELDPPHWLGDPLVRGIQIQQAMLDEAKAGYVAARVDDLEEALGTGFTSAEKQQLAALAVTLRDPWGLPDVGEAYRRLVARAAD